MRTLIKPALMTDAVLLAPSFDTQSIHPRGDTPSPPGLDASPPFLVSPQGQETHVTSSCPSGSYFDLHVIGVGYLNRIREVKPKKGDPFLACEIAALTGPSEAPEYRRFDVRVTDSNVRNLVLQFAELGSVRRRVVVGFRLGDLWTDLFKYTKGKNAGRPGISLKARLIFVAWIKVDGQLVYEADRRFEDEPKQQAI